MAAAVSSLADQATKSQKTDSHSFKVGSYLLWYDSAATSGTRMIVLPPSQSSQSAEHWIVISGILPAASVTNALGEMRQPGGPPVV